MNTAKSLGLESLSTEDVAHVFGESRKDNLNAAGPSDVRSCFVVPSHPSAMPVNAPHTHVCHNGSDNAAMSAEETSGDASSSLRNELHSWLSWQLREERLALERGHAKLLDQFISHASLSGSPDVKDVNDAIRDDVSAQHPVSSVASAFDHVIPTSSARPRWTCVGSVDSASFRMTKSMSTPPRPQGAPPREICASPPGVPAPDMVPIARRHPAESFIDLAEVPSCESQDTPSHQNDSARPNGSWVVANTTESDRAKINAKKTAILHQITSRTRTETQLTIHSVGRVAAVVKAFQALLARVAGPQGGDGSRHRDHAASPTQAAGTPCSSHTPLSKLPSNSSNKSHKIHSEDDTCLQSYDRRVQSSTFEVVFAFAILLNAAQMALLQQYNGDDQGHNIQYPRYGTSASDTYPGAEGVLHTAEKMFTVCFAMELLLRASSYRLRIFCSGWNYLDFVVVGLALLVWIFGPLAVSPAVMRLARFGKLMRVVRILRNTAVLESLKLMLASIQASVSTLFWSLIILLIIQSIAGMVLGQMLSDFIKDENKDVDKRRQVFAYYGTFWRSTITMFEVIFANWAPTCRLLLDDVSEWYGAFFVIYRCVVGFSVISVIQAVFIQQTMKSAKISDDDVLAAKKRQQDKYSARLQSVFDQLDESGDGYVSWDEFASILQDEHLQAMLAVLEVNVDDLEALFQILDDGDGMISSEEFVKGVCHIRGQAKAIDMISVLNITKRVEAKLESVVQYTRQSALANNIPKLSSSFVNPRSVSRSKWKGTARAASALAGHLRQSRILGGGAPSLRDVDMQ